MPKLTLEINFDLEPTDGGGATVVIQNVTYKSIVKISNGVTLTILMLILDTFVKTCIDNPKDTDQTVKKIRDFLKYFFTDSGMSLTKNK